MNKRKIALGCIVIGIAGAIGSILMDTTVSSSLGRIHNIGLINAQQNYLIVSGIVIIIGVILYVTLPEDEQSILPVPKGGGSGWIDDIKDTALPFGIQRVGNAYEVNGSQFETVGDAMAYAQRSV